MKQTNRRIKKAKGWAVLDPKSAGKAHRADESVRRHDENGDGVGPTTRVTVRGQSKYLPRVEDARHEREAA